jgi:hypothetical protein
MTTYLDVDTIATDADLIAEVSSKARLDRAMPDVAQRDAIRARALQDVVDALATRSPPLRDTDLANPTELKQPVVNRSLSKIILSAVAVDGDVHSTLHRAYEREYQAAVRRSFTLAPDGAAGSSGFTFRLERR